MIDLGALKISILTGADQANKELNSVGDTADKQESKFKKFGKGVGIGMAVGVTAIVSATGAMVGLATKTSETADRVDKMSGKMGLSNQAFQEWDYVMGQSGMSIDTMKVGMKTLVEQMDSANNGSEKSTEAFGKLNLTWEDGTGKLKSQEQMMQEAIYALADMEEGSEKTALATDLFGKAGTEMLPMLEGGSQGIKDLTERSHELGLILNDETIGAGVLLGDTMDDVKGMFGAVVTEIGGQFMPLLQVFLEWVLANMPTIKNVIKVVFDVVATVVKAVGIALDAILPILTNLYNWVKPYFPIIGDVIGAVFGGIIDFASDVVSAISKVIDKVKEAIDWFASLVKADKGSSTSQYGGMSSYSSGMSLSPINSAPTGGSVGGGINQTVNIYSPKALSPSETARLNKQAMRQMAL